MSEQPRILVSTIRPPDYSHSGAFDEVYETVSFGLKNLGYEVSLVENVVSRDVPTILFGGHLLGQETLQELPAGTILYNLEQADPGASWLRGPFPAAMRTHEVWDFSETNVRRLAAAGVTPRILWAPVGYTPEMTRIPRSEEDIDVLFYGSLNPRRQAVLEALKANNVRVVHVFDVYGPERDQLISRSKVVLNMHYYESGIFEWIRVFYLLANSKVVVSETSLLTAFDKGAEEVVHFSPYERLVESCRMMVNDAAARENLLGPIPDYLTRRSEAVILKSVLTASSIDALKHGSVQ